MRPSPPTPRFARPCLALGLVATASAQGDVLWSVHSQTPGDDYGTAVAVAGDVDGDGVQDFIVGAFLDATAGPGAGAARVLSGVDGSLVHELLGAPGDGLGFAVDGAGDVDGDGLADVVVGARDGGYARIFAGSDGSLVREHTGLPGDRFGWAVSGAGDVDGDQRADVIVGAPGADGGGTDRGLARVFSGADGSVLFERGGSGDHDEYGTAVDAAGNVDLDAVPDVLVGTGSAASYAELLSGAGGGTIHTLSGGPLDWFGAAVAGPGDLDGDGRADALVGAPGGFLVPGYARAFSGADGSVLFTVSGGGPVDLLGASVAGVGDVDSDGKADVAVGAPFASGASFVSNGRVAVFSGDGGTFLYDARGLADDEGLGWSIGGAAFADLVAGAPTLLPTGAVRALDSGRSTLPKRYCGTTPNSVGAGAELLPSGSGSLAAANLAFHAQGLPPGEFGYFLASETEGFVANPGGSDGDLCLGGSIKRLIPPVLSSGAAGVFDYAPDLGALPQIGAIHAGETWSFQVWYRDGGSSNFTDGARVAFAP